MIADIRFEAQAKVLKNGKETLVPLNPQHVLRRTGPVLEVTITHPGVIQDQLRKEGKNVPQVKVRGLIDTGASSSVITPKVAGELGLLHTGYQKVTSVHDERERPVYYGHISFPWGTGRDAPIVSCELSHFDCLIGRDILMHWHLTYHGSAGFLTVCE